MTPSRIATLAGVAQEGLEGVGSGLFEHPRGRQFGGVVMRGVVVAGHPCGAVRKNAHKLRR
ncbi:hypothetical protein Ais01nite_34100 [Asanoa ishikariensis]|nr:hypothetical protein Ais01nite_34100 [Asanoa ishikariensis]